MTSNSTEGMKAMSSQTSLGDSKAIISNQEGIHEKLDEVVHRHLTHASQKPYQAHTKEAFAKMDTLVSAFLAENPEGEVILDACCGVGQSTRLLAKQNPQALVIGVDKSDHRINRNVEGFDVDDGFSAENYQLVRADLNDFYRLVKTANWPVSKHYILYPNPWPKSKHLQRRWHGSAVFPQITSIGQQLILRSNWRIYLEEFQQAAKLVNLQGKITSLPNTDSSLALTPFEAKYQASGQVCWQLVLHR
ncbi:tRNA (guanine(46)-N(7))-methyltransferase TrmB [Colwellia psychrerythraea]|uniref:tRNA (guanine(46)-N(7))-methyltransferase n=1 Tax=Colwellia psychrerythraea TaxID=28229 RepID=A0A099K8L3_COLPS|nr:methyltransferase domain-containing protein [Colwellia psychrerythraea]KGJ87074.1 methyltransferase [Colwellia psychrerythraea]